MVENHGAGGKPRKGMGPGGEASGGVAQPKPSVGGVQQFDHTVSEGHVHESRLDLAIIYEYIYYCSTLLYLWYKNSINSSFYSSFWHDESEK